MEMIKEYELRLLDVHGDAQDVEQFDTLAEAEHCAASKQLPAAGLVAWALESKAERWYKDGQVKRTYTLLATGGDQSALKAGSWIK
jgi:hypothetical protein